MLALRAGSVPEVVEDGVTGFVPDDEDGLVEAVGRLGELDRARCRAEAERRFSGAAMADAYERAYADLLDGAAGPLDVPDGYFAACPLAAVGGGAPTGTRA